MNKDQSKFWDKAPEEPHLTSYDQEHMVLYLRILDANRDGADWKEVVRVLFELDPEINPERCRMIHESHLARARWMTEQGYRELVRQSQQDL